MSHAQRLDLEGIGETARLFVRDPAVLMQRIISP